MTRRLPSLLRFLRSLALVGLGVLLVTDAGTYANYSATLQTQGNTIGTVLLVAPTNVSGQVLPNGRTVRLTWTPTVTAQADGYRIYRAPAASGPFSLVDTVTGQAATTDDDNPPDGTWHYAIRAYASTWNSPQSATAGPLTTATLSHFVIDAVGEQHSGKTFSITARARTATNGPVPGFAETATFSTNAGTITPVGGGTFSGGILTQTVKITGAYSAGQTITVTGGTPAKTGTSAAFTLHDWVFFFKKTTPASATNCTAASRFREMAEGYAGLDPEETYMRTAGVGQAYFCAPAVTSAVTLPAGTTTVRTWFNNTAGAACAITVTVYKNATTQLASNSATPMSIPGNSGILPYVNTFSTPAVTLAPGDRLGVAITWASVKACNDGYLHSGGTTYRSRVEFPLPQ